MTSVKAKQVIGLFHMALSGVFTVFHEPAWATLSLVWAFLMLWLADREERQAKE